MYINPNKFYSNNYRDFVHRQALEDALKLVAEIDLKDVEIDTILSITFSVDEYGENPMYVEYLDKEGKKHIVRIRPAVTNEIQEILKKYVTLEQHENDNQAIYNYFTTLNVPMVAQLNNPLNDETQKIRLNGDNAVINFEINPEKHGEIEAVSILNNHKEFGDRPIYAVRFADFARADEVPSVTQFLEAINELENKIHTGDETTLQEAKDYVDTQDTTQRNEITTLMNQGDEDTKTEILSVIDIKYDDLKSYVDSKDSEYFETGKRYSDNAKQEAIDESKNYANTKHNEALALIEPCQTKLSNIWQSHKAPFIYWVPNIDINTMKLENKENDVKVTLNDGDVVYWRKHEYQPVDLSNYYTKPEADTKFALKDEVASSSNVLLDSSEVDNINFKLATNDVTVSKDNEEKMVGKFITPAEKGSIADYIEKVSELGPHKIVNRYWYLEDKAPHFERMFLDGDYVRTHIENGITPGETVTYTPTFKSAKETEVSALKTVVSSMGETNPIEMTIEYNGNSLELNNYSTYTTIGNTTFVNINCNFTAPFVSGTTPILNTLSISSETLKSFETFMIDCTVKTATNVSSYTTTTVFSNKITSLHVETPVIKSNETIATTLISFNGSFAFQQ